MSRLDLVPGGEDPLLVFGSVGDGHGRLALSHIGASYIYIYIARERVNDIESQIYRYIER